MRRKWGWIGHTLQKPAHSLTRQTLTWYLQGERRRGKPRNNWRRDTIAEIIRVGMTWKDAERAAQNRVRWRNIIDGLSSTSGEGPMYK
jgi:hypothetical protein